MTGTRSTERSRRRREVPEKAGQLRAADPFDLIRLLARSQHDPRKAVAELVQNSLDANAQHVIVVRYQHKSVRCLSVRDDGEGVLPELSRKEALNYIATNIGHSRKRELSVEERYRLLLQGKYGIGLLGFWSVGRQLEMRTKVGAAPAMVLYLEENSPRYEIHKDRRELELGAVWTEVVIVGLHEAASRHLRGRRLSDYLAEELRGQLLGREVELRVVDQIARGRAQRDFRVQPRRFEGVPLSELSSLAIEGHGRARLELCYLAPELDAPGQVALAASGTLVVDDIGTLPGLDHPPWTGGRLVGVVDFPPLEVAPGSRRGFVPDQAAAALVQALREFEAQILEALGRFETERRRETDEELLRQLRRLFADFGRRLPHYELFEVEREPVAGAPGPGAASRTEGAAAEPGSPADLEVATEELSAPAPAQTELFAAGPLASVLIRPGGGEMQAGGSSRLRAVARDESGRAIGEGVVFHWRLEQGWALASLIAVEDGARAEAPRAGVDVIDRGRGVRLLAGPTPGLLEVSVLAVAAEQQARAAASFEIVPPDGGRLDIGIPEPHPVHAPGEPWRSRMTETRWEYNSGHPDYLATVSDNPRKLRYITALLAKELVQRRAQRPEAGVLLEQMIEVLSWAEGKLSAASRSRRSG